VSYEKHKVFLYKEDFEKFTTALDKAIQVASNGIIPEPATEEPAAAEPIDTNLDIQF
jgi:hypothetical protein